MAAAIYHRPRIRLTVGQRNRCRITALLAEKDFEPWLSGEAGIELLKPAADDTCCNGGRCRNGSTVRRRLATVPL